jgi:hypothetical protein
LIINNYSGSAILLIVLMSFSDYSFGREGNRFLVFGGGWAYYGIRDMGISPLYYSGSHVSGNLGFHIHREKMLNRVDINLMTGSVEPVINPVFTLSRMRNTKGGLTFTHLRNGGSFAGEKASWFLGGSWNTQFAYYKHNQYINSAKNHFLISSLGADGMVSYHPGTIRLVLAFSIHVPLIAAIMRPDYAYIKPRGFLDHEAGYLKRLFNSFEISTLNRFSGLSTGVSTGYTFRNNSILLIGYRWEYLGHHDSNTLKSAMHGIYFQKLFDF